MPDDDWRKHDEDFNEPKLSDNLALVENLREVGRRHSTTPGAVAVAWTRNPAVTGAIVGARKPEQVNDMERAAGIRITGDEANELETEVELAAYCTPRRTL